MELVRDGRSRVSVALDTEAVEMDSWAEATTGTAKMSEAVRAPAIDLR